MKNWMSYLKVVIPAFQAKFSDASPDQGKPKVLTLTLALNPNPNP